MRISLKVLGLLWIGLFLLIGGLLFNAYSKLKPETFIALLREQVERNYPGASLDVGKVSYAFSLDFNLTLKNIHLRRSGKLLGSIGEVELKVPWWLLLTNRGNAQINLENLDIYVDHEDVPLRDQKSSPAAESKVKVSLPAYLSGAKFTFRAKHISVRDINNARRYFIVSKLLVREFHYGKNSAFEVNVPITITHSNNVYTSDLWLFGDVTPDPDEWRLNFRGEFRTKENNDKFQIEDLVIGGRASFNPAALKVISNVDLSIEKKTIGRGHFKADQDTLSIDLDLVKLPLSYFSFIYEEIKNPYLPRLEGEASGTVKFQRNSSGPMAEVTGELSFDGNLHLSEKDFIPGKWMIGFENSRWEVSFMSPKGEASFFRRSVVDMKQNKVIQYVEELGFSGLDLGITIAPVFSFGQILNEVPPSYFTTSVSYKKCLLGDQVLDGSFRYGLSPDQKFYQAELASDNSSFKLNYSNKTGQNAVDVIFKNFQWHSSYQFLSPFFTANTGVLEGKVEGRWTTEWITGQWLMQAKASELEAPKGKIPDFIAKTQTFFELPTTDFKKQNLNISGKNGVVSLNSLMLENAESVKITGSLSSKQKSFLTLSYPKSKKSKLLKKEVIEPYWMEKEDI